MNCDGVLDNSITLMLTAIEGVRGPLVQRQLELRPDSRIVPNREAIRWASDDPSVALGLMVALANPAIVFYECDKQADGSYRWRGARYGMHADEYYGGFGRRRGAEWQ